MRIPSTKRICLVGKPNDTNYEKRKQKVLDFVEEKSRGFKPRETVEKVRNCTKIGNEIVTNIVNIVVNLCLETTQELIKESGETWNSGGELSFPQIVQRLQDNKIDLSKLKVNYEHQGCTHEFVHGVFVLTGGRGAQHPLGPENPLGTIDSTDPGGLGGRSESITPLSLRLLNIQIQSIWELLFDANTFLVGVWRLADFIPEPPFHLPGSARNG